MTDSLQMVAQEQKAVYLVLLRGEEYDAHQSNVDLELNAKIQIKEINKGCVFCLN